MLCAISKLRNDEGSEASGALNNSAAKDANGALNDSRSDNNTVVDNTTTVDNNTTVDPVTTEITAVEPNKETVIPGTKESKFKTALTAVKDSWEKNKKTYMIVGGIIIVSVVVFIVLKTKRII